MVKNKVFFISFSEHTREILIEIDKKGGLLPCLSRYFQPYEIIVEVLDIRGVRASLSNQCRSGNFRTEYPCLVKIIEEVHTECGALPERIGRYSVIFKLPKVQSLFNSNRIKRLRSAIHLALEEPPLETLEEIGQSTVSARCGSLYEVDLSPDGLLECRFFWGWFHRVRIRNCKSESLFAWGRDFGIPEKLLDEVEQHQDCWVLEVLRDCAHMDLVDGELRYCTHTNTLSYRTSRIAPPALVVHHLLDVLGKYRAGNVRDNYEYRS